MSTRVVASFDNPTGDHCVDGFFYGLFMDADLLRGSGVIPADPRRGYVDGYALRIGRRATLVPSPGGRAYGMVFALTHGEVERLYSAPGLEQYQAEAVLVRLLEGGELPALCYNLPHPPKPGEANPEYSARLRRALAKLGFPSEYVDSVQ